MTNVKQSTRGRKARRKKTNGEQLAKVIRPQWRGDERRALDEVETLTKAAMMAQGCEGAPAAREALSKARVLASRHLLRWLRTDPDSASATLDRFAEQLIVAAETMNMLRHIDSLLTRVEARPSRAAEAAPAVAVKLAEVIPLPVRSRRLRGKPC